MTAAGGLCYTDPALAEKWYPEYFVLGKRSIIDIMGDFWPTTINERNAAAFWGFWARHIFHIRYESGTLRPYRDLFNLIGEKEYFVCSTNVDGQLEKAGFDKSKIFAPQGDYTYFQCKKPCSKEVYSNRAMIETCLNNMASPFEIRVSDIPRCSHCGDYLIPNVRCDFNFVESPHMQNVSRYESFVSNAQGKRLVLLEMGVGFNTPSIIRYPFEQIASQFQQARLVRLNLSNAAVPNEIKAKSISIQEDIGKVLQDIYR
jgi:NAD-dependent SIR2 family protein deacetylase